MATLSQTYFDNSTRALTPGKAVTGCAGKCYRDIQHYTTIFWSQASIAQTITAATLVLIVNNRTNSTRTSTIYNTEIDLGDYAPTTVNSVGTVTTSVVLLDGSTYSTRYILFPSKAYLDYPTTYSLCGAVPTIIDGVATCLTYQTGCDVAHGTTKINRNTPTFTLPSHPPLLKSLTIDSHIDMVQDPKGWTYEAVEDSGCSDPKVLRPLFPELGLWSCTETEWCVAAARVVTTALILTATSTSTETDAQISIATKHASSSPSAAVSSMPKIAPQTTSAGLVAVQESSDFAIPDTPTMTHSLEESILNGSPTAVDGALSPTVPPGPLIPEPLGSSSYPESNQSKVLPPEGTRVRGTNAVTTMPVASDSQVSQTGAEISATSEQAILASVSSNGEESAAASPSFQAESEILLPTVLVPVESTFINAKGATFVSAGLTGAGHLPDATTKIDGNIDIPGKSPLSTELVPMTFVSTNAQGSIMTFRSTEIATATIGKFTNAQGQAYSSPNIATNPVAASLPLILMSNAQGSLIISTSNVAAAVFSTTNAEGSRILATSLLQFAQLITFTDSQGEQVVATSPTLPTITAAPALTIGNQAITVNSLGQYIVGSQALTAGGAISVSGTQISLASNTAYAIVGSSTYNLATTSLPALTLGSQTISPNSQGQYIIGSQTLNPGGKITVSGTQISLAANTAYVVVGSSTQNLAITSSLVLTLSGQTIRPDAQGRYIIGSQTLTPGGVIDVSGTRISLASNGTDVVIGTSTEVLGPYIIGGLGPSGVGNGTNPEVFTGGASGRQRGLWIEAAMMFIGIWVVVLS